MDRKFPWLLALVLVLSLTPAIGHARVEAEESRQSAGPAEGIFHVVQRGETLASIAQRYGSTVDALAHANGLHDPTRIYVGQRLLVPGGGVEIDPQPTSPYIVQAGDSLAGIARRSGASWQSLARLNGLLSPDVLYAGQLLQVPGAHPVAGSGGGLHIVADGETVLHIALRYDVPLWTLIVANDWVDPALVYRGQPLLIPGEETGGLPVPFDSVDLRPLPVRQGGSLVIAVRTREPVTLTGSLPEQSIRFTEEDGVYYGLVGVHALTEPGLYEVMLRANEQDGKTRDIAIDLLVEAASFGYERIEASPSLLDPAVSAAEKERLDGMRSTFTDLRKWSRTFEQPCGGTISSYFGTRRAYNEGPYTSLHGGVDLRGATGTPVHAPAAGTVVMADELTVRGNALIIDHGWGVLTGYWHLSTIEVEVGQEVEQGDMMARIGNTGLSTGSHLHWEMWVGGVNVNPLQWVDSIYPWPERGEDGDHGVVQ